MTEGRRVGRRVRKIGEVDTGGEEVSRKVEVGFDVDNVGVVVCSRAGGVKKEARRGWTGEGKSHNNQSRGLVETARRWQIKGG